VMEARSDWPISTWKQNQTPEQTTGKRPNHRSKVPLAIYYNFFFIILIEIGGDRIRKVLL